MTAEDAILLHKARATGGPIKGDLASQAQSVAAANEQGATVKPKRAKKSILNPELLRAERRLRDVEAEMPEPRRPEPRRPAEPRSLTEEQKAKYLEDELEYLKDPVKYHEEEKKNLEEKGTTERAPSYLLERRDFIRNLREQQRAKSPPKPASEAQRREIAGD